MKLPDGSVKLARIMSVSHLLIYDRIQLPTEFIIYVTNSYAQLLERVGILPPNSRHITTDLFNPPFQLCNNLSNCWFSIKLLFWALVVFLPLTVETKFRFCWNRMMFCSVIIESNWHSVMLHSLHMCCSLSASWSIWREKEQTVVSACANCQDTAYTTHLGYGITTFTVSAVHIFFMFWIRVNLYEGRSARKALASLNINSSRDGSICHDAVH